MSNITHSNQIPRRRTFGLAIWSNLTYPQKFTVIALIFALSLLAFLPLVLEQNTRIENYGRKEAQGAAYLQFLWQLTTDLESLRLANIELQNGSGTSTTVGEALIKVEADITALEAATSQYAPALGMDVDILEIANKWATLRTAIQDRSLADIEAGFITLGNSIDALVKQTGDKSYLILDPDLDTYYVMDTVLLKLPENQALTFRIWQIANEASQTNELSVERQFELGALISQLQSNVTQLDKNLQTSIENNANGEMIGILSIPLQNYLAATQSFINLNNTYLTQADNISLLSPVVLKANYNGVRDSTDVLYASASRALENGIRERIETLTIRLSAAIMLAALSILVAFLIGLRVMRTISMPLLELLGATQKLREGDMSTRIPSVSSDEAGQVALAFNSLASELETNRQTLQLRASELERRSSELETIAEVGRDISIIRDLNTMLNVATSLIRERFGFYHTGIFLVDERNEYAVLRSANGPSSQALLEQNYKIKIGGAGVVGSVAQTGQAQVATFSAINPPVSKNPLLPETHSEIGLPLRGKSLTIGVLSIHSNNEKAFTQREVQIFQILADQLSSAIDNAQLAQQVEGTINELSIINRTQTKKNWDNTISQQKLSFEYDGFRIQPIPPNLPGTLMHQLEDGKPIILNPEDVHSDTGISVKNTLLIPLLLTGQVIGVIGLEREDPNTQWTAEEISIAEAAANRAAITLENARLLEESQRLASKEQAISQATARISTALSVENILGITAEELERVIGDSEVILQIKADNESASAK
ncbi:MAG: GAF domain-containing protein [Anaerolineales bacterium]|nr:GAF domain-containing protein [Anaerolineales bacterium]